MGFLADLWLPILLAAVFVFIISSIIHMVLPVHKNDFKKLPDEDALMAAMREHGVQTGEYYFPRAESMKDFNTPEMKAKIEQGPVGYLTVMKNFDMGRPLIIWFLYSLLIGLFVAYVGSIALPAGSEYLTVFRVTGAIAVLGYATSPIPTAIWKGAPWGNTLKHIIDGLIYGLLTAGTFAWLWP